MRSSPGGHMQVQLDDLRRRASTGDPRAQTEFGKALLDIGGAERSQAIRILDAAAAGGSGEAAAQVAVLAAAGDTTPQNWSAAVEYLVRAAEMNWPAAQAQLQILSGGEAGSAEPGAHWRSLMGGIDIKAWLRPPPARTLSENPLIEVYDGFVSPQVCRWLMSRAQGRTWRAAVQTNDGRAVLSPTRTNTNFAFLMSEMDLIGVLLQARMAAIGGFDLQNFERLRLLRYEAGQAFEVHHDWLDTDAPELAGELAAVGQRIATVLVYLNEDFEAGETDFPDIGLRLRAKTGDALFFRNVDPAGAPDRKTLHAGLPPTAGVKWVVSQWVRQRPGTPLPRRVDLRSASA